MVGIRTDANNKIAMGHLMRCMSIARQLRDLNLDVVFILSEDYAGDLIIENGFRFICLHNQYNQKELETERLMACIAQEGIDRLLIDSYEVTFYYLERLRKACKIIYIDDLNSFRYPADLIINYIYGADMMLYHQKGYQNERFLLGIDYAPLRPEFSQSRIEIKRDISAVFLSTGGTDEYNIIIQVLERLQKSRLRNVKKNVVTGKFYKYAEELESVCRRDHTICNYHDIQDICSMMHQSDLAISAGGTTVSELCACGVPVVCISIADNQLAGIKAYADAGIALYAGDIRNNPEAVLDQAVKLAECLKADFVLREDMGSKAKRVIDGKGAFRIADAIKKLSF